MEKLNKKIKPEEIPDLKKIRRFRLEDLIPFFIGEFIREKRISKEYKNRGINHDNIDEFPMCPGDCKYDLINPGLSELYHCYQIATVFAPLLFA